MESTPVWEDWLQQLKSSNPIDLPEVLEDVYKPLRLSYELLKSERAKSLFLLCCLYPEDANISLEELAIYGMGLHVFGEVTSLEQARNKVCLLVKMLKARFLLLEGYNKRYVKMHNVVRDVAIFIASDEKRINCNDCTWISPSIGERSVGLPEGSVFPNLRLLLINHQSRDEELEIYDESFEGMRELNVFSISCHPSLWRLPATTELLKNLRTLILVTCRTLESMSVIGELVNLEILICRGCYSIENLAAKMGRLSGLRLLELSDCENLKTIAPGIISNLTGLEELIVEDFANWEAEVEGKKRKKVALSELQALSRLTRLEIKINDSRLGAEQVCLSSYIVKYHIHIGGRRKYTHDHTAEFFSMGFENKIELKLGNNIIFGNWWFHKFLTSVEYMYLNRDGSGNLDLGLAQNLRWLTFRKCSTVKKLVNMTTATSVVFPLLEVLWLEELADLEEICDGAMLSNSFKNIISKK